MISMSNCLKGTSEDLQSMVPHQVDLNCKLLGDLGGDLVGCQAVCQSCEQDNCI